MIADRKLNSSPALHEFAAVEEGYVVQVRPDPTHTALPKVVTTQGTAIEVLLPGHKPL